MTDEVEERIRSAKRRVEAATLLVENEFHPDAISRAYYGVYEAAQALLLLKEVRPKTHSGVENQIGLHFRNEVNVGVLTRLRQDREGCDYELSQPPAQSVWYRVEEAAEFVEMAAGMAGHDVDDWGPSS